MVALGGGHGLAASLRAARTYASDLVGIVSVADDGGSSGRLRRELGLPAPGDLRRCLSALADDSLLSQSLEHRFDRGPLEGHPLGNLLIAGLTSSTGDFQLAIDEVARLIGAEGALHPATLDPVTLRADSDAGPIEGQVTIERAVGIRNLRFDPPQPKSPPGATDAVMQADQILIGPGSLFTSVLAAAVVPAVKAALLHSRAQRVFIANVANDRAEARGFDLPEHVATLSQHGIGIDVVVATPGTHRLDDVEAAAPGVRVVVAEVAADDGWGHDPTKLGPVLAAVAEEYPRR